MDWKCIKEHPLDYDKDEGTYLVLIGNIPKIAYFSQRNWQRSWNIPDEWKDPTHYIKIPNLKNLYCTKFSSFTMD
jgi:hypothetical protein